MGNGFEIGISIFAIAMIVFGIYLRYLTATGKIGPRRQSPETAPKEDLPYVIPLWERVLQVFLILGTAFYAVWRIGFVRLMIEQKLWEKIQLTVILIIMLVVLVFGYYIELVITNWQEIKTLESSKTPIQRYLGYLKIVFIWVLFILIDLLVLK